MLHWGVDLQTHDASDTAANQSNAGIVTPVVRNAIRVMSLLAGNMSSPTAVLGVRCVTTAVRMPWNKDKAVCSVVARRYSKCIGNMMENDECTI